MTARPGTIPRAVSSATSLATSARIAFETAVPSRMRGVMAVLWPSPINLLRNRALRTSRLAGTSLDREGWGGVFFTALRVDGSPKARLSCAIGALVLSIRAAAGVRSCSAFLGCYNEELGTICYANAGHTPGLLRDPSGITELPATGLPLGLFSAST